MNLSSCAFTPSTRPSRVTPGACGCGLFWVPGSAKGGHWCSVTLGSGHPLWVLPCGPLANGLSVSLLPAAYSTPGTSPANRSFVGLGPRDPAGIYQAQVGAKRPAGGGRVGQGRGASLGVQERPACWVPWHGIKCGSGTRFPDPFRASSMAMAPDPACSFLPGDPHGLLPPWAHLYRKGDRGPQK